MSAIQAIIWDLDDTLIDTSALFELRNARQWRLVYESLSQTLPIEPAIQLVREALAKGVPQAIVTNSPSIYAKKVLAFHKIPVTRIIAYHDVRHHKPSPEPLLLAANQIGVAAQYCLYVGNEESDQRAATAAGMEYLDVRLIESFKLNPLTFSQGQRAPVGISLSKPTNDEH
jgi:HAD superfamily hydrolase (TIGR01549 family)